MHGWHRYNEGEEIINNRVQEPVDHCALGHVLDRLEPVVDVQLRGHEDETV